MIYPSSLSQEVFKRLWAKAGTLLFYLNINVSGGKSTLLNMIVKLLTPDQGNIYINGQPITQIS